MLTLTTSFRKQHCQLWWCLLWNRLNSLQLPLVQDCLKMMLSMSPQKCLSRWIIENAHLFALIPIVAKRIWNRPIWKLISVYTLVNYYIFNLYFLFVGVRNQIFNMSFQANVRTLVPLKDVTSVFLGLMSFLVIDECILVKGNSHVQFADDDLFAR